MHGVPPNFLVVIKGAGLEILDKNARKKKAAPEFSI
jgi:hypothetical protein